MYKMLNAELMYLFDATIKHFSSEIYSYYGESLKDPEIDILLKELGIDDGDFKRLYQWKNGIAIAKQDYSIDTSILMQGNFVALDEIISIIHDNVVEDLWERKSLIPFFTNYEGEYLLFESDRGSLDYGKIFFFSPNFSYQRYRLHTMTI